MARKCEQCERVAKRAGSRSHSNTQTLRLQKVNLQWKKIKGVKQLICARCIKTLSKATA